MAQVSNLKEWSARRANPTPRRFPTCCVADFQSAGRPCFHRLIRHSVRQAHFVLVAFCLGLAISFLELACTGQVYLPTITYMIQKGETRAKISSLAQGQCMNQEK